MCIDTLFGLICSLEYNYLDDKAASYLSDALKINKNLTMLRCVVIAKLCLHLSKASAAINTALSI